MAIDMTPTPTLGSNACASMSYLSALPRKLLNLRSCCLLIYVYKYVTENWRIVIYLLLQTFTLCVYTLLILCLHSCCLLISNICPFFVSFIPICFSKQTAHWLWPWIWKRLVRPKPRKFQYITHVNNSILTLSSKQLPPKLREPYRSRNTCSGRIHRV
jgi:hypothetical protein